MNDNHGLPRAVQCFTAMSATSANARELDGITEDLTWVCPRLVYGTSQTDKTTQILTL
jgi:hypothetical protein